MFIYNDIMVVLQNIGYTAPWIILGYLIGSLNFAVIYSRYFRKEDIRDRGSGNAGATNIKRSYGNALGYLTVFLDVSKVFLALLIGYLFKTFVDAFSEIYIGMIGIAVLIGQIYPVFFGFRGGKGAACLLGLLLAMEWWLWAIGFFAFFMIVYRFKIVSIATVISPGIWIAFALFFGLIFHFLNINVVWNLPLANTEEWWINIIYVTIAYLIIIIKHIPNIRRILNGNESRIR